MPCVGLIVEIIYNITHAISNKSDKCVTGFRCGSLLSTDSQND